MKLVDIRHKEISIKKSMYRGIRNNSFGTSSARFCGAILQDLARISLMARFGGHFAWIALKIKSSRPPGRSNLVQKHRELLETLKWQEDAPVKHGLVQAFACEMNPSVMKDEPGICTPLSANIYGQHASSSSTQKDNGKTACSNNWSNFCGLWSTQHNCPPMPAIAWEMEWTYSRPKANHLGAHCWQQDDSWNYWQIHPAETGSTKPLGPESQIVQGEWHAKAHWKACTIRRGSTMGL